ncbi:hypothetical protein AQ899_09990 [Burkholderia pseudomallei]|nr:hypothetical protein AQ899_09990 [Burkholderia pseudomallei]
MLRSVISALAGGVGVLPLAFAARGAAGAQIAIGTGVLGGVISATLFAIFLVPLFFVCVGRVFDVVPRRRGGAQAALEAK